MTGSVSFATVMFCSKITYDVFSFPVYSCGVLPVSVESVTFWSRRKALERGQEPEAI